MNVSKQQGVTMIELVVSVVVIGIGLTSLTYVVANSFATASLSREANGRMREITGCFEVLLAAQERDGWTWDLEGTPFPGCGTSQFATVDDAAVWGNAAEVVSVIGGACGNVVIACREVSIPVNGGADGTGFHFHLSRAQTPHLEFVVPQ